VRGVSAVLDVAAWSAGESSVIASALARFLDHPPPPPGVPSRVDDVLRLALHGGMGGPR
jgi:hypothetical protein